MQPSGAREHERPKAKKVPPGASFTVFGKVIRTNGNDLGIRVQNEAALRAFWQANEVDTKLDWFGPGAPVFSIGRAQDIKLCQVGGDATLTFITVDRGVEKRGVQTVGFSVP
jgi:hypothetical protein